MDKWSNDSTIVREVCNVLPCHQRGIFISFSDIRALRNEIGEVRVILDRIRIDAIEVPTISAQVESLRRDFFSFMNNNQ